VLNVVYYVLYDSYCISYCHLGASLCATSEGNSISDRGLPGYISMCTNINYVIYDSYSILYSHLGTSLCVLLYIVLYIIHIVYHIVIWVHHCVPHLKETQSVIEAYLVGTSLCVMIYFVLYVILILCH